MTKTKSTEPQSLKVERLIQEAERLGLTELYLSYCDLKQIPDAIFRLEKLHVLILTGNEIEIISDDIAKLKQLRVLDLTGNRLKQLPEQISELSHLNRLELASNNLDRLPELMGSLRNLAYLDCFGNQLISLPESIVKCHNLSTMRLAGNDIKALPSSLGELSQLKILDLSDNELESIPGSISQLARLSELHLNGNCLNIPVHIISRWTYQPANLIKAYLEIKERERTKQKEEEELEKRTIKQHKKVLECLRKQQVIIDGYHRSSFELQVRVLCSAYLTLDQLGQRMQEVSHHISDLLSLADSLIPVAVDVFSEIGDSLNNPIPPVRSSRPICSLINWDSNACLGKLTLGINVPLNQQAVLAIFFSLCELRYDEQKYDRVTESQVLFEVINAQLSSVLNIVGEPSLILEQLVRAIISHSECCETD